MQSPPTISVTKLAWGLRTSCTSRESQKDSRVLKALQFADDIGIRKTSTREKLELTIKEIKRETDQLESEVRKIRNRIQVLQRITAAGITEY